MSKNDSNETKKGATPPREILYAEAAKHAPKAIDIIVYLMEHGDNDNVKLGAAKTILAKAIPDLHETEVNANITNLNINRDYISPRGWLIPTPTRSLEGPDTIQSTGVAQES